MRVFKKIIKVFFFIILALSILSVFLFTPIDRTPYQEMGYYQDMLDEVEFVKENKTEDLGDTIQVGWAKESLLPPRDLPLAGFGIRHGKIMEGIRDSIWVRAFVFDNKLTKAVFVTMDLLIVPPEVEVALRNKISDLGIAPSNLYLTATHSHSSIGAWGPGFPGETIAGEYNPDIVDFITNTILTAINQADITKTIAKVGYAQVEANTFVQNRLVGEEGIVDSWFRYLKIEKTGGETALLAAYSAHATCFGHTNLQLSADYPGPLVDSLENIDNVDFAAFTAGAVASHKPSGHFNTSEELINHMSSGLKTLIAQQYDQVETEYQYEIKSLHLNLPLREPHIRISENLRVRPWLYYQFFGDYPAHLSFLRIGNNVFVGTPCDFSGELLPELVHNAGLRDYNLIVTSFNGGYIGYITLDKWYDLNKYETRAMNWFGPYNGAYFSEYITRIIGLI